MGESLPRPLCELDADQTQQFLLDSGQEVQRIGNYNIVLRGFLDADGQIDESSLVPYIEWQKGKLLQTWFLPTIPRIAIENA